jgi:hypothetical protein
MADFRFLFSILGWAMTIGGVGGLVDLTIDMAHHAWRADHAGLISRRSLTHQLMSTDSTAQELKTKRRSTRP